MSNCASDFYLIKRFNTLRSSTSSSPRLLINTKTIFLFPKKILVEYTSEIKLFLHFFPPQERNNSALNPIKCLSASSLFRLETQVVRASASEPRQRKASALIPRVYRV
jgi:hypothetical protein